MDGGCVSGCGCCCGGVVVVWVGEEVGVVVIGGWLVGFEGVVSCWGHLGVSIWVVWCSVDVV